MLKLISTFALLLSFQVVASQSFELSEDSAAHAGKAITSVSLSSKSVMIEHESVVGPGCIFEGIQEETNGNETIFAPINEELRFGEACRVTVTQRNDDGINIKNNGQCTGFCGVGAEFRLINIPAKK
jgi:hypothetical protein